MIASSISSVVFAALLALSSVHAIPASSSRLTRRASGINKEGSIKCISGYVSTMPDLQQRVDLIDPETEFAPGEKIACTSYDAECFNNRFGESCSGICAFMCESNTVNWKAGNSTKGDPSDDPERDSWSKRNKSGGLVRTFFGDVIGDLRWFGAKNCGTAPLYRNGTTDEERNNNSRGCMTVNYVTDVCRSGSYSACKGAIYP